MSTANPQSNASNESSPRPPTNPTRALGLMLVLGIIAGVAGGLLIDQSHGILAKRSLVLARYRDFGLGISAKDLAGFIVAKDQLHLIDTALTMGLLGMISCGLIGLGRGILSGSLRTAVVALAAGAILGLAFGALGGYALASLDLGFIKGRKSQTDEMHQMYQAMLKHSVAWTAIGIAAGLTGVLPRRRFRPILSAVLPTMLAGIVAGVAFVPISAICFPNRIAEFAVPLGLDNRILWTCLPASLMALVVGRTLSESHPALIPPASSPASLEPVPARGTV